VDALIKLVFLPEATGERGRAAEKAAVDPEHVRGVDEVALDPIAGSTTLLEGATELDDESNALAVAGRIEFHWTKAVAVLSREGKSRFAAGCGDKVLLFGSASWPSLNPESIGAIGQIRPPEDWGQDAPAE